MYCPHCGAQLPDDSLFCTECGEKLPGTKQFTSHQNINTYVPGFSNKVNDPRIKAAVKKNKKATLGCAFILIPLPLIACLIAGKFVDDFPQFPYSLYLGGAISLIFLIVNLISAGKAKTEKEWTGVVTGKRIHEERVQNRHEGIDRTTYTVYTVQIHTPEGKLKTIDEREIPKYYNYLEVGDRVRYLPQFTNYYEKYDKSKDGYVFCPICGNEVDLELDICPNCGMPVIK